LLKLAEAEAGPVHCTIFTVAGVIVLDQTIANAPNIELNLPNSIEHGLFFIRVSTNKESVLTKVLL
jgi:hypothetical protein